VSDFPTIDLLSDLVDEEEPYKHIPPSDKYQVTEEDFEEPAPSPAPSPAPAPSPTPTWLERTQASLLAHGRLDLMPDLYEKVKATYGATYGNATLTSRLTGVARTTVARYAQRDDWPATLEPESVKTSAQLSSRTRLERLAATLENKMMDLADSLVVEEKMFLNR